MALCPHLAASLPFRISECTPRAERVYPPYGIFSVIYSGPVFEIRELPKVQTSENTYHRL